MSDPKLQTTVTTGTRASSDTRAALERTWAHPAGVWGWFTNVGHTAIGVRYMVTSFVFFLIGGILAGIMRIQLAFPENNFVGPDRYNQLFTVHGSTMIFLFAVPARAKGSVFI